MYVLHGYFNRGGTEEHTRVLAASLGEEFDVTIVFPEDGLLHVMKDVTVMGVYPMDPFQWPITPFDGPITRVSLDKILSVVRPDIVHVQHVFRWPLSVLTQLLDSVPRVAMSFHDYYPLTPDFTMRQVEDSAEVMTPEYSLRLFGRDITPYLVRRREFWLAALSRVSKLIVPSRFVRRELSRHFPLDFEVVEHGIVPFKPRPKVESHGSLRFGYMSSLIPQKGYESLFAAFDKVRAKRPEARLLVYGWGNNFSATGYDGIEFFGRYSYDDVPAILSTIDVGVIPSVFRESFCLVLSEFWHGKVPVAVSDIGALGERVEDGVNGLKFPPGDVNAIRDALVWFLESEEWKGWSFPAPRLVDDMIADYRALYRRLL